MEYLDFELRIAKGDAGKYPITVVRSPAGEISATMRLPFAAAELKERLQAVENARGVSEQTRRMEGAHRDLVAGAPPAKALCFLGRSAVQVADFLAAPDFLFFIKWWRTELIFVGALVGAGAILLWSKRGLHQSLANDIRTVESLRLIW